MPLVIVDIIFMEGIYNIPGGSLTTDFVILLKCAVMSPQAVILSYLPN